MRRTALCCFVALLGVVSAGCQENRTVAAGAAGTGGGTVARGMLPEEAVRQRDEAVAKSLNPKGLPVYSGPVGAVRGIVTVSGDPPPLQPQLAAEIPESCPRALELERKLYRQGVNRSLADVLVTATEYSGYVRPRSDTVRVDLKGCAFDAKVTAMVFGQRLDVFNRDPQGYLPRLAGVPTALRLALPGGNPVPIFPPKAGRYLLVDETHDYVRTDLYVLNYPTFDVTGLDGAFEITGIPAGDAKVTAFSPALGKVSEQRVRIEAGVTLDLKFELTFSQAQHDAALRANAGGAAAAEPSKPPEPKH